MFTGLPSRFLMHTPRKLPLALLTATVALLAPLSAQQDWIAWSSLNGTSNSDQFSAAITTVGDWNQDGYDDYAVSSPGSDLLFHNGGRVTIYSGHDESVLATIDALATGEQLGFDLANLGTHNGDGLPKLAVSSPFAPSANGPFSGFVRIYAWDFSNSTLSLVDEIFGSAPGALFGMSLAGYDRDGNGDLDLAVGAIGANLQDGQVLAYQMSSAGVALPAAAIYPGNAGSGEMFGWSLTGTDISGTNPPLGTNENGLAVGVPFANDLATAAGAVVVVDELGTMTQLANPLGNVANAHLGYSISGGLDALDTPVPDLSAGAPDTAKGNVLTWSGEDFSVASNLVGESVGDRYGFSLVMIPDTDFDDLADIAAGAPGTLAKRGSFRVNEVASPTQEILYTANGIAGTTGQFGYTISSLGDVNQTGKSDVGVGAPLLSHSRGRLEVFAPPAQDIGPMTLTASGSFNWATDVFIDVTNVSDGGGGDLYWYVGTSLANVVSGDGFNVNVSNGGGTPPTRFAHTISVGTTAQQIMNIEDNLPDGMILYYQMVEDRGGFVRTTNVDGGMVHDPGVTIFVDGNQAPGTVIVRTRWGIPNSPIYLYATAFGFTTLANNSVPGNNWKTNLINPVDLGAGQTFMSGAPGAPDEGDFTSAPMPVPARVAGLTIHFQAMDWDLFSKPLSNVLAVDFQ